MRKWFRNVLIISGIVLAGTIAWLAMHGPTEPVYKGQRLSVWLQRYDNSIWLTNRFGDLEADEAVAKIGTNAIPTLLAMLRAKDSDLTIRLLHLVERQHWIKINYVTAEQKHLEAPYAFYALGASASNAVPELEMMFRTSSSPQYQLNILSALGEIGPAARSAIPLLLEATADTNGSVCSAGLWSLGAIHSEPETVVPLLTSFLNDLRSAPRIQAVVSLGKFGADARTATPGLLEMLGNKNPTMQRASLRSLGQIYGKPEWTEWNPPEPSSGPYNPAILPQVIKDFGTMGTNGAPAVPTLVKFLSHSDESMRAAATNALKSIDSNVAAKNGIQ